MIDWQAEFTVVDNALKTLHAYLLNNKGEPRSEQDTIIQQNAAAQIDMIRPQVEGIGKAVIAGFKSVILSEEEVAAFQLNAAKLAQIKEILGGTV